MKFEIANEADGGRCVAVQMTAEEADKLRRGGMLVVDECGVRLYPPFNGKGGGGGGGAEDVPT